MNRKHLSLAALAVVLVALGIALLPFKAGSTDCSPAAISAWEKYSVPDFSRPQGGAGAFAALGEASPTKCAKQGRIRLEKSGVLLSPASDMGPSAGWFRQQDGTVLPPVMGPGVPPVMGPPVRQ